MSKLSIKVQIANRYYPMNIDRDDEESIRKAVQLIEEKVKEFESKYAVRDKQDVLAMGLLHFVHQLVDANKSAENSLNSNDLEDKISQIESILDIE